MPHTNWAAVIICNTTQDVSIVHKIKYVSHGVNTLPQTIHIKFSWGGSLHLSVPIEQGKVITEAFEGSCRGLVVA